MKNKINKNNILVSVVIPTFNKVDLIEKAIKSVLTQTYVNLEVIVIDDSSKDNTQEIVSKIKDKRLKYIKLVENKGVSFARNQGIKIAKGSFIAFLDSDDYYLSEKIEESLEIMEKSDEKIGLVCSNYSSVGQEGKIQKIGRKEVDTLWHIPAPSTWFLRKEVFNKVGNFDENILAGEDAEFLFRYQSMFKFKFINKPLVVRYRSKNKLSLHTDKFIVMRKIFIKKHKNILYQNKKFLAYQFYRLGKDLSKLGNKGKAKSYFFKAFLTYPIKVEYFGKWIKSLFSGG